MVTRNGEIRKKRKMRNGDWTIHWNLSQVKRSNTTNESLGIDYNLTIYKTFLSDTSGLSSDDTDSTSGTEKEDEDENEEDEV